MSTHKLVETRDELRANVLEFSKGAAALAASGSSVADAIGTGCSHAVEWVAFQDDAGGWQAAFCKRVGYIGLTDPSYNRYRKTHLTGTDTKRRVEKLGGTYYGVGADAGLPGKHPAVDAVKSMCAMFGKAPKRTAKVRVFTADERPATMDVLVAAIRAAGLNEAELKRLFVEVKEAA